MYVYEKKQKLDGEIVFLKPDFFVFKKHLTLFISQNIMFLLFVISIVEKIFCIQWYM
jgi:hypothetical protein